MTDRWAKSRLLNDKLNVSEAVARLAYGDKKVAARVRSFRKRAKANPDLWIQLYSETSPYLWLMSDVR
jgi:hypothetical protein